MRQDSEALSLPLFFWQNMPSMHQSATIKALAKASSSSVTWVVDTMMESNSKQMGWDLPDFGTVEIVKGPTQDRVNEIVNTSPKDSVHFIASDLFIYPHIKWAFENLVQSGRRIIFTSESRDFQGKTAILRRIRYMVFGYRYQSKIDGALIFGYTGPFGGQKYFSAAGFPDQKLFPFAYLMEPVSSQDRGLAETFKIVCLAQLIDRKGVDVLIQAVRQLQDKSFRMDVIGRGEKEEALRNQVAELGLQGTVNILGAMPHSEAMQHLADADLLILPSRFDGWGAVINEALMRGIPAIATDRCGSQDLLLADWRGSVVSAGDPTSMAAAVEKWMQKGKLQAAERERILKWSECISGESGARYIISILDHLYKGRERPLAPWLIETTY